MKLKKQKKLDKAKKDLENSYSEITNSQKALNNAKDAVKTATTNKKNADDAVISATEMKDAITATTNFFEKISKKFGGKAAGLAQQYADDAKGKKIRNVDLAMAMFKNIKEQRYPV